MPNTWSTFRVVAPPPDLRLSDLYFKVLDRTEQGGVKARPGWTAAVEFSHGSGAFRIPRSVEVSFLTPFGCLPEIDVLQHTQARMAALVLTGQGQVDVSILRGSRGINGSFSLRVLARRVVSLTAEPTTLPVELCQPGMLDQAGIIHFQVKALSEVKDLGCAWHLDVAPRRPVRLGVVICTTVFDQNVAPLLARMPASESWPDALRSILVVNNREESQTRPLDPSLAGRVRVVSQPNTGGCGGFTRGLVELMDDPAITHVLFMDDDIYLDFNVLANTARLFGLTDETTCLGGQMLDLRRPLTLSASGEFFHPGRLAPVNPRPNLDLSHPTWWHSFATSYPGTWNGWWYFGFPVAAVGAVGLPLPIFLKGDDIEYGLRLHRAGYKLATMPGIAVWHEPFDVKVHHWDMFFVTRNTLILAVLHYPQSQVGAGAMLRTLVANVGSNLLKYRYHQGLMIDRAMRAFLEGPACLSINAPDQLRTLRADLRRAPDHTTESRGRQPRLRPKAAHGSVQRLAGRFLRSLSGPVASGLVLSFLFNLRKVGAREWPASFDTRFADAFSFAGHDVVRIDDPDQPVVFVCRRDRAQFLQALVRLVRTAAIFVVRYRAASRLWKEAATDLASSATWERYFALNGIARPVPPRHEGRPSPTPAPVKPTSTTLVEGSRVTEPA